jgi:biopolymer transport protein ExbD
MASPKGSVASSDINITATIDILLVLLIIFMAIAPVAPSGLTRCCRENLRTGKIQEEAIVLQISHRIGSQAVYKINQTNVEGAKS